MAVAVKICGLSTPESVKAAIDHGAAYVGFVFFPPSPRNISAVQAGELAQLVPAGVKKVGVFVDPEDSLLEDVLREADLDILQLHGSESPARVQDIKQKFGRPVMKAIAVAGTEDIERAKSYESVTDMLLFDAKAPKNLENALPGGNGLIFDWELIRKADWSVPWMLSGGLEADNVTDAIATSGAEMVDVSSGVEIRPGEKDIEKIKAFIKATENKD
ncbi:phosphoribosylanthranilate isomerase [Emcibacter nanhaiensis]|uniref:N-(5'-phosphoribosyl)anthranilate isomerase n=1 Tax=Emcibacter nanhaiensis TaxID=1505037 RepID=A0A501PNW4_9PROT|nr:phosphoribosylanthranilate isomerase [Emcibacter nanhaiensis]TPD61848.1 phosphoribosylanthranilate isomerase [Emcibacter nanhaiensis]